MVKKVSAAGAPAAIGPYSHAVDTGSAVYLSGQIGVDPVTGKLASGFAEQTKQSLSNMRAVLDAAGLSLDDVALVDIFLIDMKQFNVLNKIYVDFFQGHKPARLAVEVQGLAAGAEIEIRCIAHHRH